MADVFISYSQRDAEFVQRLYTAFINANRTPWIDWQSIPRGEDWWREIQTGIEGADTFICTVSENWLVSEICHKELLHARQNNKHVLPSSASRSVATWKSALRARGWTLPVSRWRATIGTTSVTSIGFFSRTTPNLTGSSLRC